jgi:hypothetical protein
MSIAGAWHEGSECRASEATANVRRNDSLRVLIGICRCQLEMIITGLTRIIDKTVKVDQTV